MEGREGLIDLDHLRPRLAGYGIPGCFVPTLHSNAALGHNKVDSPI